MRKWKVIAIPVDQIRINQINRPFTAVKGRILATIDDETYTYDICPFDKVSPLDTNERSNHGVEKIVSDCRLNSINKSTISIH